MNFSHGSHEEHSARVQTVREVAEAEGKVVTILQDLQGPKIRVGEVQGGSIMLEEGTEIVVTTDTPRESTEDHIFIDYESLVREAREGERILIDDGLLELRVTDKRDSSLLTTVVEGGPLRSRKGVNLPDLRTSTPPMTEKDLKDLELGLELDVDVVALSFVQERSDVEALVQRIEEAGKDTSVIAKIEKPQAVRNIDDILEAVDGIMVARGDLGIEMPMEEVPGTQKRLIRKSMAAAKPVITATQMLESMVEDPRPTRAEASDVANAVFDGSDALMLSGETAAGRYPIESVRTMARIIEVAESSPHLIHPQPPHLGEREIRRVVASSACRVAEDVGATALAVFSITGGSLQLVSTFRPPVPIVGLTPSELTRRRSAMLWGTEAVLVPMKDQASDLIEAAERVLSDGGWVSAGDRLVILSGLPRAGGSTNRILVHTVGTEPA